MDGGELSQDRARKLTLRLSRSPPSEQLAAQQRLGDAHLQLEIGHLLLRVLRTARHGVDRGEALPMVPG